MIIYCDSVVLVDLFLVDLLFCLYMLKRFEFKKGALQIKCVIIIIGK